LAARQSPNNTTTRRPTVANKDNYSDRAKTLAKDAAKGVGKEMKEISKGVLRELWKIATLDKK
jgi:hypothetical protein